MKASAIALVGCVSVLIIKENNPGGAYTLSVCCAVILCIAAVSLLSETANLIETILTNAGLTPAAFLPVIKCVGIGAVVTVVSGLCKDAGQNAASSAIEYLGAAAAVYTALPLFESMLGTLEELL